MVTVFKEFIRDAEPIRLREPLAATLGAFASDDETVEFSLADTIKAAGHACPTVTGAFLATREALARLYPDEVPVRGEIKVKVYGEPDEGVNGVMGQVFSLITGAAPATGFKGLGAKFRRKDLLQYCDAGEGQQEARASFTRTDSGRSVLVKLYPWNIPFPPEKSARMGGLMEKVVTGTADAEEKAEFQGLWTEKLRGMLAGEEMDEWLVVEGLPEAGS